MYESVLRLHILPVFGSEDIGAISPHAIRHWNGGLRESDYPGVPTAVKCYRLLRAILTTAVEAGLIATNPCRVRGAAADSWMFTSTTGGPVCPRSLQGHWSRARDQLNLGQVRLHDLRHLAATVAAQTGATTKEVMYRLGHTSSAAAMRYQRSTELRDREMVTVINDLIVH